MTTRHTHGSEQAVGGLPDGVHDAPDGYTNLVRIDQGGFAIVYRALDTRFDRTVALKILRSDNLDERQLRRFNAECLATGRVSSHPNIVTVYDAGTTRGHRPWLAMEYCSGGSLAHKVARTGPLPVAEVISIGTSLCSALSAAHEAGILHRDVKPHNVLLTSYGEPALADFGIASVRVGDGTATETGAYTVVHAAPETLEGKAATVAADIYSLGSTLYTLLAGRAPFATEASIGLAPLVTRILRNDLPVIARPGIPVELEQLLRRSMAAQPRDRPASAAELGASLASLGRTFATDHGSPAAPAPDSPGAAAHRPAAIPAHRPAAIPAHRPAAIPAHRPAVIPAHRPAVIPARPATAFPISARRLLAILGGTSGVLVAVFTALGLGLPDSEPDRKDPRSVAPPGGRPGPAGADRAADRYTPTGLTLAQGDSRGELVLTWNMPIRPDVVATVIYEGTGTARARTMVSYGSPRSAPRATLQGLPRKQRVCLSAAHVISVDDKVTHAVSRQVCAVPR